MATAVVAVGLWAVPAGATPLLTVTPNAGLVDGQSVSVSASGYTPGAGLAVLECTAGASSENDCDLSTVAYVNADASSAVSTTYGVFREIFTANDGAGLDCAPSQCVLVVANIGDQTEAASAELGFDASIPPPPILQVSATIDPTGTFDKTGNVTVTGTVNCNMPATSSRTSPRPSEPGECCSTPKVSATVHATDRRTSRSPCNRMTGSSAAAARR
jgi:hypothetical protein